MGHLLDEFNDKNLCEEKAGTVYEYQNTPENRSWAGALPLKQGLYDPELEKDSCGVGFAAHIKGKASHKIISDGTNHNFLSILRP